jgi:hypothetical protein
MVETLSKPEICDLELQLLRGVVRQQDVSWFQVTVDDATLERLQDTPQDLHKNRQGVLLRHCTLKLAVIMYRSFHVLLQVAARAQLANDVIVVTSPQHVN